MWTLISHDAVSSGSSGVIAGLSYPRYSGNVLCFGDDLVRILAGPLAFLANIRVIPQSL
jgi:hypothetical protein